MIEGNQYIKTVKDYFAFLETEFGFRLLEEKVRGNVFYDVQYRDAKRVVSISYENIENYLLVIIFVLDDGQLPDYDDKTKTLHLNKLTSRVFSKVDKSEINLNNERFSKLYPKTDLERMLLKNAKELRLYLRYFDRR